MVKIIKNDSGDSKQVLTKLMDNQEEWTIPFNLWLELAEDEDIHADITSGALKISDGTDYLTPADGVTWVKLLAYPKQNEIIPKILSFVTLPANPVLNDLVFYVPFNEILSWDGNYWVGPKIFWRFGKNRQGAFPVWLRGDDVSMSPRNIGGTIYKLGDFLPEFTSGGSIKWKIYNITAKSDKLVTGDMELHSSSGLLIPDYAVTGKGKTVFSNARFSDIELTTSTIVESHSNLQMYFRRTSGTWSELKATLTVAKVATGAT